VTCILKSLERDGRIGRDRRALQRIEDENYMVFLSSKSLITRESSGNSERDRQKQKMEALRPQGKSSL